MRSSMGTVAVNLPFQGRDPALQIQRRPSMAALFQ